MYDMIEKLKNSLIQHGECNDRIYLMKLSKDDFPDIIYDLDDLAEKRDYSKIFAKVPAWAFNAFEKNGYIKEAVIPGFYNDDIDGLFLSKYLDKSRRKLDVKTKEKIREILYAAKSKRNDISINVDICSYPVDILGRRDVEKLTDLYQNVFKTYPFPIFDDDYILKTMDNNIVYFGILEDGRLIAASSAEMDVKARNVEMTDFATLPTYKGKNLSFSLLKEMENEMKERKILTTYTIARALSYGINITFSKMNYSYTGTLINNTCISGNIESMNVFYKKI
ncbi:MAG: putative beta-lysine N-acetyltransferase [Bacteroidales bacterium]|nr:putative beta-lysine N-acetyltransferase [Bacteroidales bacterium]